MPVDKRIERPYRVRFDEAGPEGVLRSSGYLRFAQDLAWIHSESAGFGREWYGERGLTWLVRGVELDILDNIEYGGEVGVSTQVIGFRRVIARRRSEFHRPGTERPVASATTDWVLLNADGRPVRPPAEILDAFVGQSDEFTALRVRLGDVPTWAEEASFSVRHSETDPMAHVNNAAYIDYIDEQYLAGRAMNGSTMLPTPRRYRAEFVGSATPGVRLVAHSWLHGRAWAYRLEDGAGQQVLRATVETDPATWAGG